jgi:thiamine pyrophosphokinase
MNHNSTAFVGCDRGMVIIATLKYSQNNIIGEAMLRII